MLWHTEGFFLCSRELTGESWNRSLCDIVSNYGLLIGVTKRAEPENAYCTQKRTKIGGIMSIWLVHVIKVPI